MRRRRRIRAAWAGAAALIPAILHVTPLGAGATALGLDLLTPAASAFFKPPSQIGPGVTLIVIDEITHNSPPFRETPDAAWTQHIATALSAVDQARPTVIGMDVIFPKTLALPSIAPGFDRPFLSSIAQSARAGRLVLSEARLSENPIRPYPGQQIAAGDDNIRSVQFFPDKDNVIRRQPVAFLLENGGSELSFAAELAARAGAAPPARPFFINYLYPPGAIDAFRLSDVFACAVAGDRTAFERLTGDIVLIGTVLDVEDRHLAGNRFVSQNQPIVQPFNCAAIDAVRSASTPRATTPGVFIHALAIRTLLDDASYNSAPRWAEAAVVFAATLLFCGLFFVLGPAPAGAAFLISLPMLYLASAIALAQGAVTPFISVAAGGAVIYAFVFGYRVLIEDREKRWITHAFQHYLSPTLVRSLAERPEELRLGGEVREAAVMFADLAGFTKSVHRHTDNPEKITANLNRFLSAVSAVIDERGGYVDKFIGDAVMGVWGAPVAIANHEHAAADAALDCLSAVRGLAPVSVNAGEGAGPFAVRIGLAAGEVLAGNLGAENRFNYSVIGDAVNLAARLEQANRKYGTTILINDDLAKRLADEFLTRPVDIAVIRGFPAPIAICELVGRRGAVATDARDRRAAFCEGVDDFRARRFAQAARAFDPLRRGDVLAGLYFDTATKFADDPPPTEWAGGLWWRDVAEREIRA